MAFGENIFNALQGLGTNVRAGVQAWQDRGGLGSAWRKPVAAAPTPSPWEGSGVNFTGWTPEDYGTLMSQNHADIPGATRTPWTVDDANQVTFGSAQMDLWGLGGTPLAGITGFRDPQAENLTRFYARNTGTAEAPSWAPVSYNDAVIRPGGWTGEGDDRKWSDAVLRPEVLELRSDNPDQWYQLGMKDPNWMKFYQRAYNPTPGTLAELEDTYAPEEATTPEGTDYSWLQDLLGSGILGMGASPSLSTGLSSDVLGMLLSSMSQGQYNPEDLFGEAYRGGATNQQPMTVIPTF